MSKKDDWYVLENSITNIGDFLRSLRGERTRVSLAYDLGLSADYIEKLENGRAKMTAKVAGKYSRYFKRRASDFFYEKHFDLLLFGSRHYDLIKALFDNDIIFYVNGENEKQEEELVLENIKKLAFSYPYCEAWYGDRIRTIKAVRYKEKYYTWQDFSEALKYYINRLTSSEGFFHYVRRFDSIDDLKKADSKTDYLSDYKNCSQKVSDTENEEE